MAHAQEVPLFEVFPIQKKTTTQFILKVNMKHKKKLIQSYDLTALAMNKLALGTRPHSERVAESLVNVLDGKLLLR